MAGTHTLTTAHTGSLVSGQPCHPRADGRNVFDCLFDLRLINKLSRPAVRTSTQFDLDILIDLIGLATECAGMSLLASGPLGRRDTLFFFNPKRSSLPMRGAPRGFERLFQLQDAVGFRFQLLREPSILSA